MVQPMEQEEARMFFCESPGLANLFFFSNASDERMADLVTIQEMTCRADMALLLEELREHFHVDRINELVRLLLFV